MNTLNQFDVPFPEEAIEAVPERNGGLFVSQVPSPNPLRFYNSRG